MAKLGSSLNSTPPPSTGRRLGSASSTPSTGASAQASSAPVTAALTLVERLEGSTLAGPLTGVPAAYSDGQDWETIRQEDVFAQLYLSARLHEQISDVQVTLNAQLLASFWEKKRTLLITGNKELEETYGSGTIAQAQERLKAAATVLADAAGRRACFEELGRRRRQQAAVLMDVYLRHQLANQVMLPSAIKLALAEGETKGFEPSEAEEYLLASLRRAGFAPVKTVNQSPNLLLATWTPGGTPLTGQAHTKVMGHEVYSLAEAGQVLYEALSKGDEKAARNLDTVEYLANIALDLKENDALIDLREIARDRKLNQTQKRLTALYLLGPGLPFYCEGLLTPFVSPEQLLIRTANSARDFTAAESSFNAGLLQIWLRAAATAEIKAALPASYTSLDFRKFLHAAAPTFPLWMGADSFAGPAQLAAYIRKDENTWKRVYGSLEAGYLSPWLSALGKINVLDQQASLSTTLLGPKLDTTSDKGRRLAVQALLQALDPTAPTPNMQADAAELQLTGLSGEEITQRTLTITNQTGGYQRVYLVIKSMLEGVELSQAELFFDQRAPGQQHKIQITGNAAAMPRDGKHQTTLQIRSAYQEVTVPIVAEAVFPWKQFLIYVGIAALTLAIVFGGVRFLIGATLEEENYQALVAKGSFLPMDKAIEAGGGSGFIFLLGLSGLVGLTYAFFRGLVHFSKPHKG